jgi:hypothetical protein
MIVKPFSATLKPRRSDASASEDDNDVEYTQK